MLDEAVKDQICRDFYSDSTKADLTNHSQEHSNGFIKTQADIFADDGGFLVMLEETKE
jgi:hypothetical protein